MAKFVKDIDRGLKRFMAEMQAAKTAFVTVGVHEGERNMEGVNIAEYATYNEYGTEDIPSRPAFRVSFDENVQAIQNDMNRGIDKVKAGGSVVQALKKIGENQQTRIQRTISNRDFLPKLADSTIAAKNGSTKTLIESGAMRGHIRYVVHK